MLKGMTDLITAHRCYEAQVQMIKTHNEVERMAAREIVGRL
jgi:flagellar basal body rod protein FlgG